jgi:stage V sporulation protein B
MIMAAALKVLLNWRLVARPDLGIIGAGYATIADMAFAAFINMYFIWRHTGYRMSLKRLARVAAAALIMGAVLIFTLSFSGRVGGWSLLLSVAAGLAVYPPLMLFMGGLPLDDIDQIPFFGGLLARRLRNLRAG